MSPEEMVWSVLNSALRHTQGASSEPASHAAKSWLILHPEESGQAACAVFTFTIAPEDDLRLILRTPNKNEDAGFIQEVEYRGRKL